jgi:hypothetical protein
MRIVAMLGMLVLAACTGDVPDDTSMRCNGAVYDPCSEEHECMSGICQPFPDDNIQVCSQTCNAAMACPGGAECNADGVCQPAAANACTR